MATEDDDLFEEAMKAEQAAGKEPPQITETDADDAPEGETPEAEATSQAAPTPPQADDQPPAAPNAAQDDRNRQEPPRIPLRELLDEREARQKFQREAEDARRQLEAFQRQQQEAQRRQQQPDNPNLVFEDPAAWQRNLQQTFQEQLAQVALNNDLRFAELKHGDKFKEGFNAFLQRVGTGQDAALYQSVMQSPSPGEAIVNWHRRESLVREVGDDPSAYEQRIREKVLAEIAAQQSSQQPNGQARPSSVTRLPPSLNRATTAAAADDFDDGDGSDEAIFRAGEMPRRRA